MTKYITLFIVVVCVFIACESKKNPIENPQEYSTQTYQIEEGYGEAFKVDNVMSLDQVVAALQTQDTVDVVMEAKVESVCKVKGCWMNLVDNASNSENSIFVKFKDYGFFMPLESENYQVLVKGKAYKEITSVDELRHYAEDEGKSEEEIALITEPTEELKIMSSGVFKVNEKM